MILNDAGRALVTAVITPLGEDGSCDVGRLADHCRALLAEGCDGVAPFGTTGEGPAFPVDERTAVLEGLLARGVPPERVLVGISATSVADAVRLARHAVDAGCPDVLLMPLACLPGVEDEGLFAFYAEVIERTARPGLRLYLYNLPAVSNAWISPELVGGLTERFPKVVAGYKDSSGEWDHTRKLLGPFPGLRVFCGHELHLPRLLAAGGTGTICGLANFAPELMARLLREPAEGGEDLRAATAIVEAVLDLPVIPACKALTAMRRRDPTLARVRPPLAPLTPAQERKLSGAIDPPLRDAAGF
jgi:4-hydroxy-tetrahydrodipicolinate synthase